MVIGRGVMLIDRFIIGHCFLPTVLFCFSALLTYTDLSTKVITPLLSIKHVSALTYFVLCKPWPKKGKRVPFIFIAVVTATSSLVHSLIFTPSHFKEGLVDL